MPKVTDLSSFQSLYLQTAKENAQALKDGLEKGDIEIAYRNAHTLKSKSFVMGYQEIGNLAKVIEDTLYNIKNNKAVLSQETLKILTDQTTRIETLLFQI
ncbi:MAG: Hpt domain-containing protein [Candidatus Levyibacteriota bacterium]|nr:MAG: Hpt domain-containing protein [Candidatus Levybacteria bacterium]